MKRLFTTALFILIVIVNLMAQKNSVSVEGYVYANDNSGYIKGATITLLTADRNFRAEVITDELGKFEFKVNPDEEYKIRVRKTGFNNAEQDFSTIKLKEYVYLEVAMQRAPGYIFEATIADWRPESSTTPVDAVEGATIEVYNKTKREVVLRLENHQYHTFHFRMEQGNAYVILIRKEGYFNKRINANISIDGCILCIEGVGVTRPGVADNLSDNNTTGTLGANISLKKITVDESVKIDNIYYDLGKFNIRQDAAYELDKLVSILTDNPHISIELSSHTDSRGNNTSNLSLSQRRAEAAAQYMISQGIPKDKITAKGYGETKLVNNCKDGINCTENDHQENRRTEFKVTSVTADITSRKTLEEMMEEELFEEGVEELMFQEVVQVSEDGSVAKPRNTGSKTSTGRNSLLGEEEYVNTNSKKKNKTVVKSQGIVTQYKISDDPFASPKANSKPKTTTTPVNITKRPQKIHKTKKVSQNYTGYKIEILLVDEPLAENHPLFREMGGIEMDVTTRGKYAYLVGNFSSEKSANHFLNNVIKGRYPKATLQQYDNGNRL